MVENFQGPWIGADGSIPFVIMGLSQLVRDPDSCFLCGLSSFPSLYHLALWCMLIWSFLPQKVQLLKTCSYDVFFLAYWILGWECFQNWTMARMIPAYSVFQYILEKRWLLPAAIFHPPTPTPRLGIWSLFLIFKNFIFLCVACFSLIVLSTW